MEEILPPATERGAGFEAPRVRQFTIFMENRVGRLQALVGAYEETDARVIALAIENSGDAALVRLIGSDPELTRQVLTRAGFPFTEQELLLVQLPAGSRRPLTTICAVLLQAEINISYAYPVLRMPPGPALALQPDDPVLAAQILIKKGFAILGESDLK
jgi:hypothetical protein